MKGSYTTKEEDLKVLNVYKGCVRTHQEEEACKNESKIRELTKNITRESKFRMTDIKFSCCKGDLCNSGSSLKHNLFLVFLVVFAVLMF